MVKIPFKNSAVHIMIGITTRI